MTLNPQVGALLAMFAEGGAIDFANASVGQVREAHDRPMTAGSPPEVAEIVELSIPLDGRTLEARLYRPLSHAKSTPLTLYFHGGGWVIGTLDTHDGTCRALANASGSAILSVAYRLAPEHPYPVPVDDCYEATVWAARNAAALDVDGDRLAVAGDSAGGNLAAAVAILARDRGLPGLRHQLLIYPVTDDDLTRPSYTDNGSGDYYLSTDAMAWFWGHYLGGMSPQDAPLARIARTADLRALPSATIVTAQYDPLRDEGSAYARQLASAGVAVEHFEADGMIHGFFSMFPFVPDAMPWIERAGEQLRTGLS